MSDCTWRFGVCFGAWSLWQGGACHCTSVSELNDLCGIRAEVGAGTGEVGGLHNHVTPNPEREPSVLCHGCRGTPPFALNFPVSLLPRLPHPRFLSPLLYCCGCVFGFQLLTLGWIQSLLPSCLCAQDWISQSVLLPDFYTTCLFPLLHVLYHLLLSAFHPLATNDCPPPAFDWQLYVCTCPSHLMFTFAPVAPPENQTWTINGLQLSTEEGVPFRSSSYFLNKCKSKWCFACKALLLRTTAPNLKKDSWTYTEHTYNVNVLYPQPSK